MDHRFVTIIAPLGIKCPPYISCSYICGGHMTRNIHLIGKSERKRECGSRFKKIRTNKCTDNLTEKCLEVRQARPVSEGGQLVSSNDGINLSLGFFCAEVCVVIARKRDSVADGVYHYVVYEFGMHELKGIRRTVTAPPG
jgi:hypothetical protein